MPNMWQDDLEVLHTLWNYRARKPLFPSLLWLSFEIFSRTNHPLVFLSNHLRSLKLPSKDTCIPGNVESFLEAVVTVSPRLQELDLGNAKGAPVLESSTLSSLVCRMNSLRHLSCGWRALEPQAILHLASLPSLRVLHIRNPADYILQCLLSVPAKSFPLLQHLSLRAPPFTACATLLTHLRPHELVSVTLTCETLPNAREVEQYFWALRNSCSTSVFRCVTLADHYIPSWNFSILDTPDADDRLFTSTVFAPLLGFENLTTLEICLSFPFKLSNDDILDMAIAWPKLQCLQLGSVRGWKQESHVTFDGLVPLAIHCPDLERLGLTINGTELPNTSELAYVPHNKLTHLHLGSSIITDADVVAAFLLKLFPNLKPEGIGGVWDYSGPIAHLGFRVVTRLGEMRGAQKLSTMNV